MHLGWGAVLGVSSTNWSFTFVLFFLFGVKRQGVVKPPELSFR